MGFLNLFWTVQGAAWWASIPALPLGRQELDEGLAKNIHSPLLYRHIKRGRNCFSLDCPGFVHILLQSYGIVSAAFSGGQQYDALGLSPLVLMCASEGTQGMMWGAVWGSLVGVFRQRGLLPSLEKNAFLQTTSLHLISVPNIAVYFMLYNDTVFT